MDLFECAGHGVLAADRTDPELHLGAECAEQSGQRLAPSLRIVSELLKVFLETQIYVFEFRAGRHQLADGIRNCEISAVERALFGQPRIIAPGHDGTVIRMFFFDGDLLHHRLDRGLLVFASERHQHRARADRGVKTLAQSPSRTAVEASRHRFHLFRKTARKSLRLQFGFCGFHGDVLFRAVRVEERTADIHDPDAVPGHGQARFRFYDGDPACLQVLFRRKLKEPCLVFCLHAAGHTLLGFTDGKLRSVESLVFSRNRVQVDVESVRKLADRDGYAACAEVIAAFDQPGSLGVSEQSLELALFGRIALLHLSAAVFDRVAVMRLG